MVINFFQPMCHRFAGMFLAVSLPIMLTSADNSQAQDAILGLASESCRVYMTTYEHNPKSVDDDHDVGDEGVHYEASYTTSDYIVWLQGYLSAYNIFENDEQDVSAQASIGGMLAFLYRRCSENPDTPFHTVLPPLLERLQSR